MSAAIPALPMKICRRCGESKPLLEFAIRKFKTTNGTAPWCNSCQSAYHKEWKKSRKRGITPLTSYPAEPHPIPKR